MGGVGRGKTLRNQGGQVAPQGEVAGEEVTKGRRRGERKGGEWESSIHHRHHAAGNDKIERRESRRLKGLEERNALAAQGSYEDHPGQLRKRGMKGLETEVDNGGGYIPSELIRKRMTGEGAGILEQKGGVKGGSLWWSVPVKKTWRRGTTKTRGRRET